MMKKNRVKIPDEYRSAILSDIRMTNHRRSLLVLLVFIATDTLWYAGFAFLSGFPSFSAFHACTYGAGIFLAAGIKFRFLPDSDARDLCIASWILLSRLAGADIAPSPTILLLAYTGVSFLLAVLFLYRSAILPVAAFSGQILLLRLCLDGYYPLPEIGPILSTTTVILAFSGIVMAYRYQAYLKSEYAERRLHEQTGNLERLSALKSVILDISHTLSKNLGFEECLSYILKQVVDSTEHASLGCILLLGEDGILSVAASYGYRNQEAEPFKLKLEDTFFYKSNKDNLDRCVIINDIQEFLVEGCPDLLDNESDAVVKSSISSPIILHGKIFGLMNIDSTENHVYDSSHLYLMDYLREQIARVLENRELYERTVKLSRFDALTGFYNRWYLEEIATKLYPKWKRHGENFVLAMIDLDDLKKVNDSGGHKEGDDYIRAFAFIIKSSFRSTDMVIRVGGDEFIGLFFGTTAEFIRTKLERADMDLANRSPRGNDTAPFWGFSTGLAEEAAEKEDFFGLLRLADERLYECKAERKKKGGSRIRILSEKNEG